MNVLSIYVSKKVILCFSAALSLCALFAVQGIGSAAAVVWPDYDYQWTAPYTGEPFSSGVPTPPVGDNSPDFTVIALQRQLADYTNNTVDNDSPEVVIGVYTTGNTEGTDATFTVDGSSCALDDQAGTSKVRIYYNQLVSPSKREYSGAKNTNGTKKHDGNFAPIQELTTAVCTGTKKKPITLSNGTYDPEIGRTKYDFHIWIEGLENDFRNIKNGTTLFQGFRFRLKSFAADNVTEFGALGDQTVPFTYQGASAPAGYINFHVPMGPKCNGSPGILQDDVWVVDSDNYFKQPGQNINDFSNAQRVGTHNQALKLGVGEKGDSNKLTALKWLSYPTLTDGSGSTADHNFSGPGFGYNHGWRDVTPGDGVYMPSNSGTGQTNKLAYNFSRNKNYSLRIFNAGSNNFLAMRIPFDEINGRVLCNTPSAPAAEVTISGPTEYEIGSNGGLTYTPSKIKITADYCNPTTGSPNTVTKKVVNSKAASGPSPTPGVIDVVYGNCTNLVTINGTTYSTSSPPLTKDLPDIVIDSADLASVNVGDNVGVKSKYDTDAAITIDTIVYSLPYANFTGNDIYACGSATPDPSNGHIIFNVSDTDPTKGAAVEYAALALNGFGDAVGSLDITTASGNSGQENKLRKKLVSGTQAPCNSDPQNYYTSPPTAITTNPTGITTFASGYYKYPGNLHLNGAGFTSNKVTIHATGNVKISANLGANLPGDPYNFDNDTAPVVIIIADGNINIEPNVITVNAILIAKGTINTCNSNASAAIPSGFIPATANIHQSAPAGCATPLVINGALKAPNIIFRRTNGSRLLGGPAEQINYPGYLNFVTPYLRDTSGSSSPSLLNAPPYL